jgi:hypothetical protein
VPGKNRLHFNTSLERKERQNFFCLWKKNERKTSRTFVAKRYLKTKRNLKLHPFRKIQDTNWATKIFNTNLPRQHNLVLNQTNLALKTHWKEKYLKYQCWTHYKPTLGPLQKTKINLAEKLGTIHTRHQKPSTRFLMF